MRDGMSIQRRNGREDSRVSMTPTANFLLAISKLTKRNKEKRTVDVRCVDIFHE